MTVLGYSAMAATIGGGGLGGIAIIWGHQRSHEDIIWVCVLLIVLIVQVIQELGMAASTPYFPKSSNKGDILP